MAGTDPLRDGISCMLMRGGTSKGAFFVAGDLPSDSYERNELLLRVMGSPDPTQIDGLGGAHPLTSKVAIVSRSSEPNVDIDYLFLQIVVDEPVVSDRQTCGNMLAGVGPFAIERGLVRGSGDSARLSIRLVNTGDIAIATFALVDGRPDYDGGTEIDGVPGTACPIDLELSAAPGKSLLPSGHVSDEVAGYTVSLVDNGMPVVLVDAGELGVAGDESPTELENRADLTQRLEQIRIPAGALMGLGDVSEQTVPKVVLLSAPRAGGAISTRAFIPKRVHTSIGVLMAASVAAGIRIPGAVGSDIADLGIADEPTLIEHPSGVFPSRVQVERGPSGTWSAASHSLRTARKIFDGRVFPRPRL